jgi:hypothetical protein
MGSTMESEHDHCSGHMLGLLLAPKRKKELLGAYGLLD